MLCHHVAIVRRYVMFLWQHEMKQWCRNVSGTNVDSDGSLAVAVAVAMAVILTT